MRDSTHEVVKSLWHLIIAITGCALTNSTGIALIVPFFLFYYFLKSYFVWVEDDGDEVSDLIEEIKQMLKDNPPQILEEDKPKVTERQMKEYFELKSRNRRRSRR